MAEVWLWRSASITTLAMPFVVAMRYVIEDIFDPNYSWSISQRCMLHFRKILENDLFSWTSGLLYGIARIIIIVETFVSLRSVPTDVYQNIHWTSYLPKLS